MCFSLLFAQWELSEAGRVKITNFTVSIMNFGVVFVLIFYLKSDQMKDGFVQCLTSACLVDVGFGGTSIKSCKRYFTESFHTKAVELVQSCRSRCLADRSV